MFPVPAGPSSKPASDLIVPAPALFTVDTGDCSPYSPQVAQNLRANVPSNQRCARDGTFPTGLSREDGRYPTPRIVSLKASTDSELHVPYDKLGLFP